MAAQAQPLELPSWQQLCDQGSDLVLCLDSAPRPASSGFAALASSSLVDARFLHIGQSTAGQARHWAGEVLDTGRRVRAVLGHREGSALAAAVADAIAEAGRTPPAVLLFDATTAPATRTGTPLFLSSRDHEPDHARTIALDVDRDELLTDPEVVTLVADLLRGEQSWSS